MHYRNLVFARKGYAPVTTIHPSSNLFIHIAVEIDHCFCPLFIWDSPIKKQVLRACEQYCKALERSNLVIRADVFKARLLPPGRCWSDKQETAFPKYDVAILIETGSERALEAVRKHAAYRALAQILKAQAKSLQIRQAENTGRVAPVYPKQSSVFLFNYFYAEKAEQCFEAWKYTSGWYEQETRLKNANLLKPLNEDREGYTALNYCSWKRWIDLLPSILFKSSFRTYVRACFGANQVAVLPVLYQKINATD
ncbi:MAG: hypothetical protein MRY78_11785 [Saprospiraceae bacterium]|nr:hypothetical protein [Saprospiraceae bacterium]